jgi:hypothetical protein
MLSTSFSDMVINRSSEYGEVCYITQVMETSPPGTDCELKTAKILVHLFFMTRSRTTFSK